jgi:DNA-binding response OmpR family regulator
MADKILVVEDDPAIVAFLAPALEREGFEVQAVRDGAAALDRVARVPPELILLDLLLPGVNGLDVCRAVRGRKPYIPIIMLTALSEEVDKVVGLELGADDYITKPFSMRELIARVRAVLRRSREQGASALHSEIQIEQLTIDREGRIVTVSGRRVELTPKEFDLLATLAAERGRVFGREMLLERVWGYDYMGESRTVDVHVQRLRSKIEPDPDQPRYLLTIRGIGYRFATEEEL